MNEILKSEIFIVIYGKNEGVSFEEFGGLFREVHGYNLNLSNYGYSSLRELLKDMNDLVELKTINGQHTIRCKSPSRHHVVVSYGNNSSQEKEQISDVSNIPLPSSGHSSGSIVSKTAQRQPISLQQNHLKVNKTNSARRRESKGTSKSKCCLPAQNPDPAFSHMNNLTEKTATITKSTKGHGVSTNLKPPTSNPVHARPAGNVPVAAGAAKSNNISKKIHKSNFKPTNPKPARNSTLFQNVSSTNPKVIESMECFSRTVPEVRPGVTYASICANNVQKSQVYQNGQQFNQNNLRFNVGSRVNSTNATQSYPRAETRASTHSKCIIKENIQLLLNQHNNGLSVFQLQKLYLFKFGQPLKFRGSATLKQLLLELKDVVKIEGVGVQMLVFPVPVESHPTSAAALGDSDAALKGASTLLSKKSIQQEIVSNPHCSNSLKRQNEELQEDAQLPFHYERMDPIKGHITKVVKIHHKPSTQQNMQSVENVPHAHYIRSSGEELSVPATDTRVSPTHINEKPQQKVSPSAQDHHQLYKTSNQDELSYLGKNAHAFYIKSPGEELSFPATDTRVLPNQITEKPQNKALPSAQEHHQIYRSSNEEEISYLGKNAHTYCIKSPGEELSVLATDERVSPNHINKKSQHNVPPFAQEHHQIYKSRDQKEMYLGKNVALKGATTKNGSSQNVPEDSSLPHVILHSSGVSFVMGQPDNRSQNKESEINLPDAVSPVAEQKIPYHNNMLKGPQHSTQLLSNASMILQDTKPHQVLLLPIKDNVNLHLQSHNSINTMRTCGQTEPPALQPLGDFQTVNNCSILEHPPSHSRESLKTKTVHVQIEKPSPIHKKKLKNRTKVKQEAALSSHSEEITSNSQIINNFNNFSNVSSNEKAANIQPKNVIEKTSQQEASVSSLTNDLDKDIVHLYVDGTEQVTPISSNVQKADNIQTSKREQDTSTLQTKQVDEFTTAESIVETSLLSSRPREKIVDVQIEKPSPIHKTHKNRTKVKQEAALSTNSEEITSNSQVIDNFNNISNVSSNEKAANIQPKNVIENTSQREASVSPLTNDLDKVIAHDLYVDGPKQATLMSSDVQREDNIHTSKREQDKSTLQMKQVDEFTTAESIVETSLLSSRPREEIVDPPKNIFQQPTISAAQSELQNNFKSISEQEDMNTWQTSQAQVCCIL